MGTLSSQVWNRAARDHGGSNPGVGDQALASLLVAHRLIQQGGVLHAIELMTAEELERAIAGYRYLGLEEVAALLSRTAVDDRTVDYEAAEAFEISSNEAYARAMPDESVLLARFEANLRAWPDHYAPL